MDCLIVWRTVRGEPLAAARWQVAVAVGVATVTIAIAIGWGRDRNTGHRKTGHCTTGHPGQGQYPVAKLHKAYDTRFIRAIVCAAATIEPPGEGPSCYSMTTLRISAS